MDLVWTRSYGAVTVDDICEKGRRQEGLVLLLLQEQGRARRRRHGRQVGGDPPAYDRIFSASRPALERLRDAFDYAYEKQKELRDQHGCALGCPSAPSAPS
jgi:TetR/AcrR family transcriptional repressor of nem operon